MQPKIVLKKVKVHNLKEVDLSLDPNQLIVFTGISGSGKSSLAFDTIYVEGQRRYIESLSTFARRHLGEMKRPQAEAIEGISPTISIEQKTVGRNPRSTVGTLTGIYDFMRVLYARVGLPHCPVSGERVSPQSTEEIVRKLEELKAGTKLIILAPLYKGKKGTFKDEFAELLRKGFTKVRFDREIVDLSEPIKVDGKKAHDLDIVVDRIKVGDSGRLKEAITQGLELGEGVLSVVRKDEEELFSQHAYSPKSGLSYGPLEPQDFSFNHPLGMCPACNGLGNRLTFTVDKIIDPELSIADRCCSIGGHYNTVRYGNIYDNLARIYKFKITTPWKDLPKEAQEVFLYGTEEKWTKMRFYNPRKGQRWTEYVQWNGVVDDARKRYQEATSDVYKQKMEELMEESVCPDCHGERIRPYPAATKFRGETIGQVCAMPIEKALAFFEKVQLRGAEKKIAEELVKEIRQRLFFLNDVGLSYLSLERGAPTLSGGEAQRVRLASQIGSGLSKATYILDEPSIGLHQRDNTKLLASLGSLRDKGNTVIVVEHDEETILAADHIVDVGPLAGSDGGEVLVNGSLQELLNSPTSVTGAYLSGKKSIAIPKKRRPKAKKELTIVEPRHHNLKGGRVKIPLERLVAITGVSGSGKSSLIADILHPALTNLFHHGKMRVGKHKEIKGTDAIDKVIAIDQTPIGRTPRSNPATYIKMFDLIRDLFTKLPEAQAYGYKAGRFSFNVKEGSCPQCGGMGMLKIDMDFMEDEWTECPECEGKRFDPKTLSILYKGKSIFEVLDMTVEEARPFFENIPSIAKKLETLLAVGLGYIKIGQSSPTLSGGEAQRIKLAKELSRPSTGKTLYILDEPTTGLHFHDIDKLIQVLQALTDKNNSVLVIEHNMDLVKTADWIIDLGPEGGDCGGQIVATGTPEIIAKGSTPTGKAVHHALNPPPIEGGAKKERLAREIQEVTVTGAEQNNLKKVDATIPHGKITVCTGPSGSGKSSFAFDTIYAEGERRYTESMSAYARQYVKQSQKPKVEGIDGLLASIAIEQKNHAGNPRSTIGTMTEAYDYLRVLFAHLGTAYCPESGEKIESISTGFVHKKLMALPEKTKVQILSPLPTDEFDQLKKRLLKEGFLRIRLNDEPYELDQEIPFDPKRKNTLHLIVDRLTISKRSEKRLFEALETAATIGNDTLIAHHDDEDHFYNLAFAVPSTGKSYPRVTPHTFSFNTAHGMCHSCQGLGHQFGASLESKRTIMRLSPYALINKLWKEHANKEPLTTFFESLFALGIDPDTPLDELSPSQLQVVLSGSPKPISRKGYTLQFQGIGPVFASLAKVASTSTKDALSAWVTEITCPACKGTRLNPLARHIRLNQRTIHEVCDLPLDEAKAFVDELTFEPFLQETHEQLSRRLHFLNAIGLDYLSLARSAPTLSGGETQRIRLARQLGSWLTGCLYVLDEPTIGLHPHNNTLLNEALLDLCKQGNTLLLVEHDPLTINIADQILDFGPKAGKEGGHITARGTLEEIKKNKDSLTGDYLSGRKTIPTPTNRRSYKKAIQIENASLHNLKNLSLEIPLGIITCVSGVSGSGKSTLINDLLRPALNHSLATRSRPDTLTHLGATFTGLSAIDKLLVIDQNPIGTTSRADISTYSDLSTPLRKHFAELKEAKIRGLQSKHFSHNHLKGMCRACWGLGYKNVQMQFLPPVRVTCDQCHGFRLNPLALEVKTRGKHLGHFLQLTVDDAIDQIPPVPKVLKILETLQSVGLGYLQLGQEIATLSGGEAQRLRLARELAKRATGKTLYIFDEPTAGLHPSDIELLLPLFHRLADKGNSVVIIEHNLDILKNADRLIDLGPGAGINGGELLFFGTPEELPSCDTSLTAQHLSL